MANFTIPKKDIDFDLWEKNIEAALEETQKKYENILKKKDEKKELLYFIKTLRKCLSLKPKDRPDFISLFKKSLKALTDYESIKSHILIEDSIKIPSLQDDSVKIPDFHNFELRGYSQDKLVSAKIWGKCKKIPISSCFTNEK